MPTINLTDNLGFSESIALASKSGLDTYLGKIPVIDLALGVTQTIADVTVGKPPFTSATTGLTFSEPVSLGSSASDGQVTLQAGVSGNVGVTPSSQTSLFASDPYGSPIPIPTGSGFVSVSITGTASAKISVPVGAGAIGSITFGIAPSRQIAYATYLPFAAGEKLSDAIEAVFEGFTIPATLDDINAMPAGAIATVEGQGSLTFSATANPATQTNPLAGLTIPVANLPIAVAQTGSVSIGISAQHNWDHQVRVQKVDSDTVSLGYHCKVGSAIDLTASASLGIQLTVDGTDLISKLLQAISGDPKVDVNSLKAAGLSDAQIASIQQAVTNGIQRQLALALTGELSNSASSDPAFLFTIKLSQLNPAGQAAVASALCGDLSGLLAGPLAGVIEEKSILTSINEGKRKLNVNLLGIFNSTSVSDLLKSGQVLYEPNSGELVITDSATATSIAADLDNYTADASKLRKLLAQGFQITVVYQGVKNLINSPAENATQWYFTLNNDANPHDVSVDLRIVEGLSLTVPASVTPQLQAIGDFGRTTFLARAAFDDAAIQAAFFANGKPRLETDYEQVGLESLGVLVLANDSDGYRRLPVDDPAMWQQMKNLGPPSFDQLFPNDPAPARAVKAGALAADYIVITGWAGAMSSAAAALDAIRQMFAAGARPWADPGFQKLRADLSQKMSDVVKNTQLQWGEPWGMLAMFIAANGTAQASAQIDGPKFGLLLPVSATAPAGPDSPGKAKAAAAV